MSTVKTNYASSVAETITLNSLASSATAAREGNVIDNSTNDFLDVLLTIIFTLAAGTPANDQAVYVYVAGSEDGTNYDDNVAAAGDAGLTMIVPTNLKLIGIVQTPTNGGTYKSVFSVAKAFGGIMPRKFVPVVRNYSGQAFASSGCSMSYSGITSTVA